jgi:hypothetical protein
MITLSNIIYLRKLDLSELKRPENVISSNPTKIVLGYCYHSNNVISFPWSHSDHNKQFLIPDIFTLVLLNLLITVDYHSS